MQPAITDEQVLGLLPACQRGEMSAVEALYDLYADRIYRYILLRVGDSDLAAELTTEVFIRVLRHIRSFRVRRQPAASLSAWVYRIAANLITDHRRKAERLPTVDLADDPPLAVTETEPHHYVERNELLAELREAFDRLSEDQRLVVLGKFGEGMSNAEIAAWLGKSEGAVKSLQHRALQALGRLLGAHER